MSLLLPSIQRMRVQCKYLVTTRYMDAVTVLQIRYVVPEVWSLKLLTFYAKLTDTIMAIFVGVFNSTQKVYTNRRL